MSYANNNHNQLSESNMITIPPHSRSAAVNAKHAKECAEIGGVDITDQNTIHISKSVIDAYICSRQQDINNKHTNGVSATVYVPSTYIDSLYYTTSATSTYTNSSDKSEGGGVGIDVIEPNLSNRCWAYSGHSISANKVTVAIINVSCKTYLSGKVGVSSHADMRINGVMTEIGAGFGTIIHPDNNSYVAPDKEIGVLDEPPSCNMPSSYTGNPINIAVGNKYQHEIDIVDSGVYPLSFERFYNSVDGLWRHNYSVRLLDLDIPMITLSLIGGKSIRFYNESGIINSSPTNLGTLKYLGSSYEYTSPFHEISDFDSAGRLTRTVSSSGLVHNIKHVSDTELIVSDTFGHSLTITETKDHQPLSVKSSDGTTVHYEYDSSNRLVKVTKNGKSRIYHYEDSRFPTALTGITDERGIRYATWGYDSSGRANLSEHSDGKDKVSITYNSDTQTTFTNPLGRKYTYNYKVIDGVKRITSIQGAASSLCPAIGSSYEYNSRGLVTVKTDGKGIKTTYEYNDAGQELSRTIGYGSAEALTIKTTWDDRFFAKPKTETYPDKVITYNYDNNGNLLNQTVKTLN